MNEILRKRIEDFASEYTKRMYKNSTDGEKRAAQHDVIKGAEFILCRQWISVDEALPEYDEAVIARNCNGEIFFCHRSNRIGVETDDDKWCNYTGAKIVLWMPTPEFETKK